MMALALLVEFFFGLVLLVLGLCACLLVYARWNYGTLESLGIPVVRPHWFLGSNYNHHKVIHHLEDMARLKTMGHIYGVYDGREPRIFISDPELIRLIYTSPEHFDKRRFDTGLPLMNEALELIQTDDKWRAVRSHLTPILTTGKLKQMNEQMMELADEHVQRLHAILCSSDEGLRAKVDFGQFLPPFAIEMIGKTLCGIKFENVGDPNNQFIKDMRTVLFADGFTFDWTYNWTMAFPFLMKLHPLYPKDFTKLLEDTMRNVLDAREVSGLKHPDMVGKLLELRQKIQTPEFQKLGITETTVYAQAYEFFLASLLGICTEINYLMYFLALNPDLQDKLIEEIDRLLLKNCGQFDQSLIGEFQYLTACMSETFRIQSAFFRPERVCKKDWQHEGLRIKKGMVVVFPIFAVHHDPDVYPNPSQFDPDRFLDGGASTSSFSFLSFGQGQRACIGQRYIYDMIKIFLVKFFRNFRVEQRKDTVWKVYPGNHMTLQHDPIYLDLVWRKL